MVYCVICAVFEKNLAPGWKGAKQDFSSDWAELKDRALAGPERQVCQISLRPKK